MKADPKRLAKLERQNKELLKENAALKAENASLKKTAAKTEENPVSGNN